MNKSRYYDLKDRGFGAFTALYDLERVLYGTGMVFIYVDEDDEHFKDKEFITDSVWFDKKDGYWGMTFEEKKPFLCRLIGRRYLRLLLWFAKHGAYED